MSNDKPKNADQTLNRLRESLDADILTDAMTDAEVDQELRDAGGDPEAIVQRGRAQVDEALRRRRALGSGPYRCAYCGHAKHDYGLSWCMGCGGLSPTKAP